jgi:hypothetical protein
MTDTAAPTAPVTRCGACGQSDDHPKHMILVGFNNEHTDGMFHAHDHDRDGVIEYHFDCPTPWHDLHSKLATVAFTDAVSGDWTEESAAQHRATAEVHAAIVAKAKEGVHGDELRQWIVNLNPRGGAGGIDQTRANNALDAYGPNSGTKTVGSDTITGPIHLRLMTANGSDTAAGTELGTSGGYTAGGSALAFAAAASGSKATNASVSWTNMPSTTLTGCEEWDTSGTPLRIFWAPWSAGTITVGSGNTFTVASGSLTNSLA